MAADINVSYHAELRGVKLNVWEGQKISTTLEELDQFLAKDPPSTSTANLTDFEAPMGAPDNFVQQLLAYFVAPVEGKYVFYVTCSGACKFSLSLSEGFTTADLNVTVKNSDKSSFHYWTK